MRELLIIYFIGLCLGTFWPEKVSSVTFVNVSESLNFEIDPDSPVMAAEKDLISYQQRTEIKATVAYRNLNQESPKPIQRTYRLADYSTHLIDIRDPSNVTLMGPLELKQGLALTDDNRIEIHREKNGQVVEYGDVDIENGTYMIKLSGLEGHLCARLRGSRYEIIGQGCFSLDVVKQMNKSTTTGPMLSLSKYQDLFEQVDNRKYEKTGLEEILPISQVTPKQAARAPSTYKTANQIYDYYDSNNSEPKVIPNVSVDNAVSGSEDEFSYLVSTIQAPGYVPVRVVGNGYTPSRGVPMQRSSTQKAAHEIAKAENYAEGLPLERGLMWGRTMRDGKALAGVEVSVDGRDDLKPLYLNEFYIPDPNQKVTASHGLYMISSVPDGEYALRAQLGNQFLGFQNASVRTGTMSLVDVDSSLRKKEVKLSVYDLVNKTSQPAVVTLQNYEEDVVVEEGQAEVLVPDVKDTSFAIVNPLRKEFLTAQYLVQPDDDLYNFPLVRQEFLDGVLSQVRLEKNIRGKIVMGIGGQEPFQVQAIGSKAQVVYFDTNGIVQEGSFGPAGGGFLVIDPEDEVVEYAIQYATQKSVRAYYMPAQVGVLSVIQMY